MTDFNCPICGTLFNDDEYRVAERLSSWSYLHLDIWVKCPECKYTPAFGKELSDAKPVYWRPEGLPYDFRKQLIDALNQHTPRLNCPFCKSLLELHKIWVHTWKQKHKWSGSDEDVVKSDAPEDVREAFQFIVTSSDKKVVDKYFIPAGVLSQYKCTNQKCKYVRYITL